MKPLEFEYVPVADAKQALDEKATKSPSTGRPLDERKRISEEPLLDVTRAWLASLPADVRPNKLSKQFPRVANRLRHLWKQVARCEQYLDDLLVDRRGTRKGFSLDVTHELAALREYYAVLHPTKLSNWDNVEERR